MTRGALPAVLALAASVVAAAPPISQNPARPTALGTPRPVQKAEKTQEFRFRGMLFTIPVSWSVQRVDRMRFRTDLVTVTGGPSGPRLTFSATVHPANRVGGMAILQAQPGRTERNRAGVAIERYEMPNAVWSGVLYVFPEAGVSVSAQVRSPAEADAADAIIRSARRALPAPRPARS